MEVEMRKPKKKRIEDEEEEEGEKESERLNKKLKAEQQEEEAGAGSGVPTEEEVEEFYAILRRMKEAVKYFDDKGKGRREWREALEQAELTVVDGEDDGCGVADDKKQEEEEGRDVMINEGFDLNAVAPEAAESGGA